MYDSAHHMASSPLATYQAGDRFGAYTIERLLGIGGMACVYAATTHAGDKVALKILRDDRADDAEVREQFMREARTGASLHHPNIVRFVDFGSRGQALYLAMERVHGITLWDWVKNPPSAAHLISAFDQILQGLAHAHARGVIHRDLKPDNILLEQGLQHEYRVRIIDFGVAQHNRMAQDDIEDRVVGTPEYMSPEQCLGSPTINPGSDLYAVGVMFYELLCGKLPFGGSNPAAILLAHLQAPLPAIDVRSIYKDSASAATFLKRLLAREPAERFLTAAAARQALLAIHLEDRFTPAQALTSPPASPIRRSNPPPVSAGLFMVSDPPYVDIRDELRNLQHRLHEHLSQDPRALVILVEGHTGSGRSLFTRELASRAVEAGVAQSWDLKPDPHIRTIHVFREMLRQHYPAPIMHPDDRLPRLRAQLTSDGFSDPEELELALSLFVDDDENTPSSDTVQWDLIRRLLHAVNQRHRTIIVLEDAERHDPEIMEALYHFVDIQSGRAPVILINAQIDTAHTYPAFTEGLDRLLQENGVWMTHRHQLPIRTVREIQRFLERSVAISPSAATLLADHADGNPSYAILILRSILQSYGDDVLQDLVSLERALSALPRDTGDMLATRIENVWRSDTLTPTILHAVESLAFLGQNISQSQALKMLQMLGFTDPNEALINILSSPELSSIVQASDTGIRFYDRLTREAIIARTEREGRAKSVHQHCVQILMDDKNERHQNVADIARHCVAAGWYKEAQSLFLDATQKQARQQHIVTALLHVDGAIHTVEQSPNPNISDLGKLLLIRAELLQRISRFYESGIALQALDKLGIYSEYERPAKLLRLLAKVHTHVAGDARQGQRLLEQAVRQADAVQHERQSVLSRLALAELYLAQGAFANSEQTLRALLHYPRAMLPDPLYGNILLLLAANAMVTGVFDGAHSLLEQAQAYFDTMPAAHIEQAHIKQIRGSVEYQMGNYQNAAELLRSAQEDFLSIGDRTQATRSLNALGRVAQSLGQSARARACWEQALDSFERIQDAPMVALTQLQLAGLDAEDGRWRSAGQLLLQALSSNQIAPLEIIAWSDAMIRLAKEAITANRVELGRDLLHRTHKKLALIGEESFIYDRLEEVAHLLYQLES